MASHKAAKKSIRQTIKRTLINSNRIGRVRTYVKKANLAIKSKIDESSMLGAFSEAQSEVMKGVRSGCLHKNTASRIISKLSKKLKAAVGFKE
jgi:small subunit ribosomal protein S20